MIEQDFKLIEADPKEIFEDAKRIYKQYTGVSLPPAAEITYALATVSALLGNIKAEMNQVALGNYLPYAQGKRLDLKGKIYGERGKRLEPNKARTTMKCYISTTVDRDVVIPVGTRFIYKNYVFHSEKEYKIKSGTLEINVPVVCEVAGDVGKILKNEITEIVDKYDYYEKCCNITDVTGGRDEEHDKAYRERIAEIPESFSSAGSEGAYKFWTKKASSLVTDVVIKTPTPNVIDIYIINNQEVIAEEEKEKIKQFLNREDIRALNDKINLKDPSVHNYTISITYYLYDNAKHNKEFTETNLKRALEEYAKSFKIGMSLNQQDIITICKQFDDIKRVEITSPIDHSSNATEICKLTSIDLHFGGSEKV